MSGTTDKAKGRVKEAAGVLTGDESLEREGKIDRATGAVKNAVEKASDAVKNVVKGKRP